MISSLLLALLAAASAPQTPGVYFEQTTLIRQAREAAPGVRSRVWCSGSRMRLEATGDTAGPALVLRLDEGRVLRLDPEAKLATELDASRLRARSQADAALTAGLITSPGRSGLRTSPLPGERTIAGHVCRGFRIDGGTATVEAWVAKGLPIGPNPFAAFLEWSGAGQALAGLVEAIRALPGFPLETRVRVDVLGTLQETVSTITAVRVMPIAAERFEVPAGWRIVKETPPEEDPR